MVGAGCGYCANSTCALACDSLCASGLSRGSGFTDDGLDGIQGHRRGFPGGFGTLGYGVPLGVDFQREGLAGFEVAAGRLDSGAGLVD